MGFASSGRRRAGWPGVGVLCVAVLATGSSDVDPECAHVVDTESDAAGVLALCDHLRAGLDRAVHRSSGGRQETVLLQGCAVSVDRAGMADGLCISAAGLAVLSYPVWRAGYIRPGAPAHR